MDCCGAGFDQANWLALNGLTSRHIGKWRRSSVSLPNNSLTAVTWDIEDSDPDGMIAVPFSTFVIPTTGDYTVTAVISGLGGTAPTVRINSSSTFDAPASLMSGVAMITVSIPLNTGDSFQVLAYQNSGAPVNITGTLYVKRDK